MPAYNSASTIGEALESVVAQTHSAWEVIVVDDGSTDATGELARQFAARDERIRVVSQPNGGESCARNTGVGHSGYDWLHFLDADDWIAPACLERLTAELTANPELDAVHCRTVRVAKDGTLVNDDYMAPSGDLFPTLARRAAFFVHACTVRRSLVEEVGRFDTSLKKAADWDLWQRIARTGARFGAVREVLAYYRMMPNSSSLEAEQLFCDVLTVLKRGHSTDPRVKNPHPDYAAGWRGNTVESQEFYLLAWCAGLMMGRGRDAKRLLKAVKNDRYAELYPPAVALSIFEAATLPACETPSAWETIWPDIHGLAEKFLVALERQSGTPDLASRALLELKKLVLKHSTTWAPVIAQQDLEKARLEKDRGRWEQSAEGLKRDKALLETQAADWQQVVETLKFEGISLRDDLSRGQQEKAALQAEATNLAQTASRLEQDKKSLEDQSGNWRQLTERLQQENASLIGNWERLASALTQEKKSLEEQRSTWQELAARLEQEKASLRADLDSSYQVASRLEQERASLTADLDSSRQVASRLEQEKASLTAHLDSSRQVVSRLEQEKASLTADLDSSHRVNSRLEQEKASLTAEISTGREAATQLEQEKKSLDEQRNSLQELAAGLEQAKASLTVELAGWQETASRLEQEKRSAEERAERLQQDKESLKRDLHDAASREDALEQDTSSLAVEASAWKRLAGQRESAIAELRTRTWIRLGTSSGLMKTPGLANDGIQGDPSEFITKTAELRTAGGGIAKLLLPAGNPEVLRIDIEKIGTKTPWDIQVNLANLKVKLNQRYSVCFRARADERRSLMVGFAKAYEPWDSLGLFRNVELTTEWRSFQEDFVAIADDDNARIHFDLGDRDVAVEISAVKLRASSRG